jgi:predicted RNA-binding protein with PUA-like domain
MSKSWFFQANSEFYRIRDALAALKQFRWSVKQYQSQVHIDDTVYLWETGANGGLLAKARVATEPHDGVDPPHELPYYVTPPTEPSWIGVNLEIEEVYAEPLKRAALLEDSTLANTQLIRNPRRTNFPMTDEEASALEVLLGQAEPTFAEIVRRYHDEWVVFSSPERGALYSIVAVDERGCDIARLSAQEPARVANDTAGAIA